MYLILNYNNDFYTKSHMRIPSDGKNGTSELWYNMFSAQHKLNDKTHNHPLYDIHRGQIIRKEQ